MKQNFIPFILFLVLAIDWLACQQPTGNEMLQTKMDSLEKKLAGSYKPGFGEFMSSIQIHHAKLWFAGQAGNWKLADFEVHEIMETLEDLRVYQAERKESKMISMIDVPLDSIKQSIEHENISQFRRSFIFLTQTCNNCHAANAFDFNRVKIPDNPPFDNQDFNLSNKK